MRDILLLKIRLSWYFVILFLLFVGLALILPRQNFAGGALTLFSVNSFLYGFYISPILSEQKSRINELHRLVRSESNAIFAMVLSTKEYPEKLGSDIRNMFTNYVKSNTRNHRKVAEVAYERIITYCVEYKGKNEKEVEALLDKLVANQQNRTMLTMQLEDKVYSNEWMIILMLFSITLSFVLLLDTGTSFILRIVTALLCTGLTMLLIILLKLSTLTHKKARQIWKPMEKLIDSNYYRTD